MRTVEIEIEKFAVGGAGFGHVDGKACFVPFTAPGDVARVRVTREKKSYLEAELLELVSASSERVPPPCPTFGDCGGCTMQHIGYADQLAAKQQLFTEQLQRFARVDASRIAPIVPSDTPWGYRSRVQIKLRWIDNRLMMGFYRSGTHLVVPFPELCATVSPLINTIITELREALPSSPEPDRIPQVDVATGDDGQTIVIIHYIGEGKRAVARFFLDNHERLIPSAGGIWLQHGRKQTIERIAGLERLSYGISVRSASAVHDLRLSFSRGGFSQVNLSQNRHLVRLVCEMAELRVNRRVLDLYCGNGNLTLPLALLSPDVTGIEEYPPSIADAQFNARSNGIEGITFLAADCEAGVKRLVEKGELFDLVVLDPPRSGAACIMKQIPALKPGRVIYVSCDPVTLARDIAILKNFDYSVTRSVPVDMFPQTSHIESVTLIERC